jgi:HD-GYP domain-containing protein (c-di-GMP phosphodiesterase class II)
MILKGDCFDGDGNRLIDASKPITKEEIDHIKSLAIPVIYYRTSKLFMKNEVSQTIISDQSIGKALSVLQDIEHKVKNNHNIASTKDLHSVVEDFIREIKENSDAYLNLLDVFDLDEYTYSHAINVSTMSIMLGMALKLEAQKLFRIGIAGLLLDIGKSMIPKEVLFKKEPLTHDEMQMIRNHPVYGYNLLKGETGIHKDTLDGVLLHHENFMGGGYPFGFTHEKLSYAPQILTICDTFDAATTNRPYRGPLTSSKYFRSSCRTPGKNSSRLCNVF